MSPTPLELTATVFFAIAIIHTFSIKLFQRLAARFRPGSVGENFFHLLGEVEIIFGLWAGALIAVMIVVSGVRPAIAYVEQQNFSEPVFVFVIMAISATRPVVSLVSGAISVVSRLLPLPQAGAFYLSALVLGPLLGSLITEPAAMTVTALVLKERYFISSVSSRFKYFTLAVLFVNVSIGGVLTHFAAPPVIMVAAAWGWGTSFMISTFGWKAIIAVLINAAGALVIFRKWLSGVPASPKGALTYSPWWLTVVHLTFLAAVVLTAHHPIFFIGLFLFFLGIALVTREYQDELKLKESLLVGFFLGGLVVLGGLQRWWLSPLLASLSPHSLFVGATFLTGIVDNAALTYLGAQVTGLEAAMKYALVAGAVSGGGLTVIANAPNPAGFAILKDCFGEDGIDPVRLFLWALSPTVVAMMAFWLL